MFFKNEKVRLRIHSRIIIIKNVELIDIQQVLVFVSFFSFFSPFSLRKRYSYKWLKWNISFSFFFFLLDNYHYRYFPIHCTIILLFTCLNNMTHLAALWRVRKHSVIRHQNGFIPVSFVLLLMIKYTIYLKLCFYT